MDRKYLILVIFLISLNFVLADNTINERVIKTYINISLVNNNANNTFNATIYSEDDPIHINNLNLSSSYQSPSYLITLIRSLSCSTNDLQNLTSQCLEKLNSCDINAITQCKTANDRQFTTIQNLQAENLNLKGISGNLTQCQLNLGDRQNSLTQCTNQVGTLQNSVNDKWYYLIIGGIIGTLMFYFVGENTRKSKGYTGRIEKEYGTKPMAELDIPPELKANMEKFKAGDTPINKELIDRGKTDAGH